MSFGVCTLYRPSHSISFSTYWFYCRSIFFLFILWSVGHSICWPLFQLIVPLVLCSVFFTFCRLIIFVIMFVHSIACLSVVLLIYLIRSLSLYLLFCLMIVLSILFSVVLSFRAIKHLVYWNEETLWALLICPSHFETHIISPEPLNAVSISLSQSLAKPKTPH